MTPPKLLSTMNADTLSFVLPSASVTGVLANTVKISAIPPLLILHTYEERKILVRQNRLINIGWVEVIDWGTLNYCSTTRGNANFIFQCWRGGNVTRVLANTVKTSAIPPLLIL